jgi:hypothetical protein
MLQDTGLISMDTPGVNITVVGSTLELNVRRTLCVGRGAARREASGARALATRARRPDMRARTLSHASARAHVGFLARSSALRPSRSR